MNVYRQWRLTSESGTWEMHGQFCILKTSRTGQAAWVFGVASSKKWTLKFQLAAIHLIDWTISTEIE